MRVLYFDCSAELKALYDTTPGISDILPFLDIHIGDPDPADRPGMQPTHAASLVAPVLPTTSLKPRTSLAVPAAQRVQSSSSPRLAHPRPNRPPGGPTAQRRSVQDTSAVPRKAVPKIGALRGRRGARADREKRVAEGRGGLPGDDGNPADAGAAAGNAARAHLHALLQAHNILCA